MRALSLYFMWQRLCYTYVDRLDNSNPIAEPHTYHIYLCVSFLYTRLFFFQFFASMRRIHIIYLSLAGNIFVVCSFFLFASFRQHTLYIQYFSFYLIASKRVYTHVRLHIHLVNFDINTYVHTQ